MSVPDVIFLSSFIFFSILLMFFGLLSFFFNYLKFSKVKNGININTLSSSVELKRAMKSPFWIYIIFINSKLMSEIMHLVNKIDDIKTMHTRYNFFLKLQLVMLLLLVVLFVTYVVTNIFIAWFY